MKKRIDSQEIKAIKIGPRMFIPQNEIDRLMGISSGQISAPKPETANSVSGDSTKAGETEQNGADLTAKSPKERLDELLEGYADFLQRSMAAVESPEERNDQSFCSMPVKPGLLIP